MRGSLDGNALYGLLLALGSFLLAMFLTPIASDDKIA